MPTHRQMLKEFFSVLGKIEFAFFAGLMLAAVAVWRGSSDASTPLLHCAVAGGIWLVITALLYFYTVSEMKKQKPFADLYAEKGICDELLEMHSKLYPNPNIGQRLRRVDLLLAMYRFPEAEALLNTVPRDNVPASNCLLYYNCMLFLFAETGRASAAYQIFQDNRKMLDGYARMNQQLAAAYYGTAMTVTAMHGDAEDSGQYLSLAEQAFAAKDEKQQIFIELIRLERLYALGRIEEADAAAVRLRTEITESTAFEKEWQRAKYLQMLDHIPVFAQKA